MRFGGDFLSRDTPPHNETDGVPAVRQGRGPFISRFSVQSQKGRKEVFSDIPDLNALFGQIDLLRPLSFRAIYFDARL